MKLFASTAGWVGEEDQPEKWRVGRAIRSLAEDKLIDRRRRNEKWRLTEKGEKTLEKDAL